MSKVKVTKELVLKVKEYKSNDKYSNLTQGEIALLCGTTGTSVSRILNGEYDHLLSGTPSASDDVTTVIPYEELKRLVACEYCIDAILQMCKLSEKIDGALFIDYKATFGLLKAHVPEKVNARVEELKEREEVL